jgi:hypothetical protein
MKWLGLAMVLAGGCLGGYEPSSGEQGQNRMDQPDLAAPQQPQNQPDLADPPAPPDLAPLVDATPPPPDLAGAFGSMCTGVGQGTCLQNLTCFDFGGVAGKRCTRNCTIANQAQTCTKPPSTGICTPNQVCGF